MGMFWYVFFVCISLCTCVCSMYELTPISHSIILEPINLTIWSFCVTGGIQLDKAIEETTLSGFKQHLVNKSSNRFMVL